MAAMPATNTKTWGPLDEQHRANGLSATAPFDIPARRIARTAWPISTLKTAFDPGRLDIDHRILDELRRRSLGAGERRLLGRSIGGAKTEAWK